MKCRWLCLVFAPVLAWGLNPASVHASGSSAVWKVVIDAGGVRLGADGQSLKVETVITCPRSANSVVIDVSATQSSTSPAHESEGEAESVPVTCRGGSYEKDVIVPLDPTTDPYIQGVADIKAVLDMRRPVAASIRPNVITLSQDGLDMASDVRSVNVGNSNKVLSWVTISGGETRSGGKKVDVNLDYQCARSQIVDIRAYVDQDLGLTAEAGRGDAEGLATKSGVKCTGNRQSTTITVTQGSPTTPTEGSAPCEDQNTPPPITIDTGVDPAGNPTSEFTPEADGGTFNHGNACIQVQFNESVPGADVHAAEEGVFTLDS